MSELQAEVQFQIELGKFYNVDLFQRGFYQLRTILKMSQKILANVEVSPSKKNDNKLILPSSVVNGVAFSKVFQILYRKEDIEINDVFLFKVQMLVDILKIDECFSDADFQLAVELWFTEEDIATDQLDKLQCISQRSLKLHMRPTKGIHHHTPLLFDYFHLSAIAITVHATLISLQQPYISLSRNQSSKSLKNATGSKADQSSLESALFGSSNSYPSSKVSNHRRQLACQRHKLITKILLSAYESIQSSFEMLVTYLPSNKQVDIEHTDCYSKLEELCTKCRNFAVSTETEDDDLFQAIQTDMSTLCSQNIILWMHYLDLVTLSTPITRQLAKEHHIRRVKRFSEGFFMNEYQKQEAIACFETSFHGHNDIATRVRNSEYYQSIPPLPVECTEIDGDFTTLPIIFEDIYSEPFDGSAAISFKTEPVVLRKIKSNRDSQFSVNSSASQDSLSPKNKRSSMQKFIKNVRPESFKRPSSYLSNACIQGQVALEQTDCTLVGYRKLDQNTTLPSVELGTLNNTDETLAGCAMLHPCLYNAVSMPTLFGQGHSAITNSGSLPELVSNSSVNVCPPYFINNVEKFDKNDSNSESSQELNLNSLNDPALGVPQSLPDSAPSLSDLAPSLPNSAPSLSDLAPSLPLPDSAPSLSDLALSLPDSTTSLPDSGECLGEMNDTIRQEEEVVNAGIDCNQLSSYNGDMHSCDFAASSEREEGCHSSAIEAYQNEIDVDDIIATILKDESKPCDISNVVVSDVVESDVVAPEPIIASLSDADNLAKDSDDNTLSVPSSEMKLSVRHQLNESVAWEASGDNASISSGQVTMLELIKEEYEKNRVDDSNTEETENESEDRLNKISRYGSQLTSQKLVSQVTDETVQFSTAKEHLRRQLGFQGRFYSDFLTQTSEEPYFWSPEKTLSDEGIHLVVCVHGLDGNSTDLRLVRTYLELALTGGRVDFLMSERNQVDTFADFEVMTDRLVQEILYHIDLYGMKLSKISFIGHSLGNLIIRSAMSRPHMAELLPKLHTFLSLSGPHLGTLFNSSGLVNMGMWLMQKWKKSGSLLQLSLKDHSDPRQTFLYKLSQKTGLEFFRNILLVGSQQDRYVPFHSSRIELCKAAVRDTSGLGAVYTEMVNNILQPIIYKSDINFIRYDVFHALTSTTNHLIGRAAHIAVLDSELFIEKFITVAALKYFL